MNPDFTHSTEAVPEVESSLFLAVQQLQEDKETYGLDHIHHYVQDVEGDWLENWDWEDDFNDYLEAFEIHLENQNYHLALETLNAGFEYLMQPTYKQLGIECYQRLISRLDLQTQAQSRSNSDDAYSLLTVQAKQKLLNLMIGYDNAAALNSPLDTQAMNGSSENPRMQFIRQLLCKVEEGIFCGRWQFERTICSGKTEDVDLQENQHNQIPNNPTLKGNKLNKALSRLRPRFRGKPVRNGVQSDFEDGGLATSLNDGSTIEIRIWKHGSEKGYCLTWSLDTTVKFIVRGRLDSKSLLSESFCSMVEPNFSAQGDYKLEEEQLICAYVDKLEQAQWSAALNSGVLEDLPE